MAVYTALRRTQITGKGPRRGNSHFLDMAAQIDTGLVLEALEELLGHAVLKGHIVLHLQVVPILGCAEGGEGADAGAFGRCLGVGNIVAQENAQASASANTAETTDDHSDAEIYEDGIEVYEVRGAMYYGKMMIVQDPSRVRVAVIDQFTMGGGGMTLLDLVAKYDCIAGVNGGKYEDESGLGTGGMPEGIVISEGKLLMGDPDTTYGVYGFTNDNVLVVGNMTAAHALAIGVRDAVSFGPALIVNGNPAGYSGIGSGLNPRTAIGQREDGAVLLLVIEGRQTSSMGASMSDLIEVMLEYGAVNAANLDGGMSSSMVYEGEEIISNCQLRYPRKMPTAFVVERSAQ